MRHTPPLIVDRFKLSHGTPAGMPAGRLIVVSNWLACQCMAGAGADCHTRLVLRVLLPAGNVVELILSIAALQAGLYDVVATSLLGSILSNLLLVLGMSFFVGGLK